MNPRLPLDPVSIERWQRLALGIRLAYNPQQPAVIRQYLGLGQRLVQRGRLTPARAWTAMLELLRQTAADEALPWFWRSVCLEHMALPLARATALQRHGELPGWAALRARIEATQAALDLPACGAAP